MSKYILYGQVSHQDRKMEKIGTVNSYDVMKVVEGFYKSQWLDFNHNEIKDKED